MRYILCLACSTVLLTASLSRAAILLVPTDYPTIQGALDAALDGDEVVVEPGSYFESIVIPARSVTLRSQSDFPENTTLDGSQISGVELVKFDGNPTGTRTIRGLTLRNATDTAVRIPTTALAGHHVIENCRFIGNGPRTALHTSGASVDIRDNRFVFNRGTIPAQAVGGGAIMVTGSAQITGNLFRNNKAILGPLVLTNGGAIHVVHLVGDMRITTVDIVGNTFENNTCTDYGGGIYVGPFFNSLISDNVFVGNSAGVCAGGIYFIGNGGSAIERNLFVDNASPLGGAIGIDLCQGIQVRSNTIVGSKQGEGIRVEASSNVTVEANLVAFGEQWGVRWAGDPPILNCNNAFGNATGDFFGGTTGTNLSVDPLFCNAIGGDYTLAADSPCLPPNNSCGVLIGAFAAGCAAVPVEETTWGRLKSMYAD